MKKIKKAILLLVSLATMLFVFTLVINMPIFDEALLPEVAAIKNIKPKAYGPNNAYPAFLAINSASKDLTTKTAEIRAQLNKKITESGKDYLNNEEYDQLVRSDLDNEWQNEYPMCNSRRERGCMGGLFDSVSREPITSERLLNQLDKYENLISYSNFSDATQMELTSPLISFGPIMALKRLYLANSYSKKDSAQFIEDFNRDLKFWRMILQQGHYMITKMVAVATLNNSIGALSKVIDEQKFSPEQLTELQMTLKRLNSQETDMTKVWDFEFKHGVNFFEEAEKTGEFSYIQMFDFFQLNATQNLSYKIATLPVKKLSMLNAREFFQYINSKGMAQEFNHPFNWSPTSLYNPTGKILVSHTLPAYADYVARIHDLDGMILLLKLKIELVLNQEKPARDVIANSEYKNPYTSESMSYNAESNVIYFECMDKTSDHCELDL